MREWETRAEYEADTPPISWRVVIAVWIVAIGVMVGAAGGLEAFSDLQHRGEAPEYTCNPEDEPYVRKECQ